MNRAIPPADHRPRHRTRETARLSTRRVAAEPMPSRPPPPPSLPTVHLKPRLPDASKTAPLQDLMPARCVSGTEVSQKRNAATQYPTQHILLGTRDTSPTRVAQGPSGVSDQKTNHNPHRHETPPIGPHSHQRPPHTPPRRVHAANIKITVNSAHSGSAASSHPSEPQRTPNPRETMVSSSVNSTGVVVQQLPCVRDVLPIVSGRCRATIRARRATTSSQRSRCPSTRSRLASALQPSRVATIPHSQWHFTAPPPLI